MAPTEASILSNFLLSPAPFTSIISLQQFTDLFPRSYRSNPQVKLLYRELQHLRALDLDEVKSNIAKEVKLGEKLKQDLRRTSRSKKDPVLGGEEARDADIDSYLFSSTSNLPVRQSHTVSSILPELEKACQDVEVEIQTTGTEINAITEELKSCIGDLSDLRYGKFRQAPGSENGVSQEVLSGLTQLEEACRTLTDFTEFAA